MLRLVVGLCALAALGAPPLAQAELGPRDALKKIYAAAKKNDLSLARQALTGSALEAWGNPEGLDRIRSILGKFKDLKFEKDATTVAGSDIGYRITVTGKIPTGSRVPVQQALAECDQTLHSSWDCHPVGEHGHHCHKDWYVIEECRISELN
jgi:hypothetical protein